jgi:hypothetical protein
MIKKILGIITSLAVVGVIVMVVLEYKGYSSMLPQGQSSKATNTTITTNTTVEQQAVEDALQEVESPAEEQTVAQAEDNVIEEQPTSQE